jgi:molybdopterin-containing oxidoreductase family iron-sulfur binding subunit
MVESDGVGSTTALDELPSEVQVLAPGRHGAQGMVDLDRRQFLDRLLVMGATGLAGALGGGYVLGSAGTAVAAPTTESRSKQKYRYGMVIDTRRCVGCKACMAACKIENKTPPGVYYTMVVEDTRDNEFDRPLFMTKPCFHCEHPPCTKVCPVSATFKREQDGIVVIDYDRCIGCRYCITACPYGARYFDFGENYEFTAKDGAWESVPSPEYGQYRMRVKGDSPIGNVRKCTFCLHLQDKDGKYSKDEGRWPACAKTCTGRAIHFGDFKDSESDVSRLLRERQAVRLKEELGTEPNVYYLL